MDFSVDFGGSTIDVVTWKKGKACSMSSFERRPEYDSGNPEKFLESRKGLFLDAGRIFVTGGKSRGLPRRFHGIRLQKVSEIRAIGMGGYRLLQAEKGGKMHIKAGKFLVVSMGTGTCMVKAGVDAKGNVRSRHVGGTGVGGGTFVGLCARLLGETSPERLKKMFLRGDRGKVDLSVRDIVGGGIGVVPGDATASNLARIGYSIDFSRDDLAAGIVSLVGQTIGTLACFAARAHRCGVVVLCGKLTGIRQVTEAVLHAGDIYKVKMLVPRKAGFVSALGAFGD